MADPSLRVDHFRVAEASRITPDMWGRVITIPRDCPQTVGYASFVSNRAIGCSTPFPHIYHSHRSIRPAGHRFAPSLLNRLWGSGGPSNLRLHALTRKLLVSFRRSPGTWRTSLSSHHETLGVSF